MQNYNRVKFTTATTGTGALTVGTAVPGFRTPAQASIPEGATFPYTIKDDDNAWELGKGTYTVSGTLISREVFESSNSNNPINLSGNAIVALTVLKESLGSPVAAKLYNFSSFI